MSGPAHFLPLPPRPLLPLAVRLRRLLRQPHLILCRSACLLSDFSLILDPLPRGQLRPAQRLLHLRRPARKHGPFSLLQPVCLLRQHAVSRQSHRSVSRSDPPPRKRCPRPVQHLLAAENATLSSALPSVHHCVRGGPPVAPRR